MADWIHMVFVGIQKKTKNLKPSQRFCEQSQSSQSSIDENIDSQSYQQTISISKNFGVWAIRETAVEDIIRHRLILLFQNKIWSLQDKQLKIVLVRFLNHLNSTMKEGHFSIDCARGSLLFCKYKQAPTQSQASKKKKPQIIRQRKIMSRIDLNMCSSVLRDYIPQILSHVNCTQILDDELRQLKIKKIHKFEHRLRDFLNEAHTDLNETLETYRNNNNSSSLGTDTLQKIFNLVSNSGMEYLNQRDWSITNSCDYIEISQDQVQWKKFHEGQTYQVSKAFNIAVQSVLDQRCQSFIFPEVSRKNLIRKIEREDNERMFNEVNVLTHLKKFRKNPNLVNPMLCRNEAGELIVQYASQVNFDSFLKMNREVMSLNTQFNMLLQIAKGLRALYIRRVIHRNIKETNVLIEKNLNCRVNDMSWAIDVEIGDEMARVNDSMSRGCMLAPEYRYDSCCYKTDVFHFGRMMLSVVTGANNYMSVIDRKIKSQDSSTFVINVVQRFQQSLPKQIAIQTAQLCFRCLEWEPSRRPSIEWVITILNEVLNWLVLNNF